MEWHIFKTIKQQVFSTDLFTSGSEFFLDHPCKVNTNDFLIIVKDRDIPHTFRIPSNILVNFLMTLEDHYIKELVIIQNRLINIVLIRLVNLMLKTKLVIIHVG